MVLKMSAKKFIGAVAVATLGILGLAGCSSLPGSSPSPSHTTTIVHASASATPAALSSELAAIVQKSFDGDWLEEQNAADGHLEVSVAHSAKAIGGLNLVAKNAVTGLFATATDADSASQKFFESVHSSLKALSRELAADNCSKILKTKSGYLAVCSNGTKFDVALASGSVERIYETSKDSTGKVSRTQYLYTIGSGAGLKALFAAATKK